MRLWLYNDEKRTAGRSSKAGMGKKVLLIAGGIAVSLAALELVLRFIGFSHYQASLGDLRQVREKSSDSDFTVLCLGDSFTFGIGAAEGYSYPGQLERLLNAGRKDKKTAVINRSIGMYNTAQVLSDLDDYLETIEPDLIILMIGGANYYNRRGLYRFLKGDSFAAKLYDRLWRIRVFNLAQLLYRNVRQKLYNAADEPGERSPASSAGIYAECRRQEKPGPARYRQIKTLVSAEGLEPGDVNYYKKTGAICKESGLTREALDCFMRGMRLDPQDAGNYHEIGWIYRSLGNDEEALRWFKRGIKANPYDSCNYNGAGLTYQKLKMYERAVESYKKGIETDAKAGSNYYGLAALYKERGELAEAKKWFEKCAQLPEPFADSYYQIGMIEVGRHNFPRALFWLKKALKAQPQNNKAYWAIGTVYRELGSLPQAEQWFKKAFRLNPLSTDACRQLYRLSRQKGENLDIEEFVRLMMRGGYRKMGIYDMNERTVIGRWIISDVGQIIRRCRAENVSIVLMNYPQNRNIAALMSDIGEKYNVPVVDNFMVFGLLLSIGGKQEDYFVPDGHCNARGYGVIAGNLFHALKREPVFAQN